MTVEKAIEEVQFNMSRIGLGARAARRVKEAKEMAIEALKKVQAFEAIGTIEELQALKEKAEPKMMDGYYCPICRHYFEDGELHLFCPCCGQALDWQ